MSFNFFNSADFTDDPQQYFSSRSRDYECYRPTYPAAAIEAILNNLQLPLTVADVGAGTGIGARLLARSEVKVWAVEPSAAMRESASPHAQVEFLAGSAEAIPLPSASVDVVSSFQAFHWFDFQTSLQEFRRVLKPQGRLALVWSFWDGRDPITHTYSRLVLESAPKAQTVGPAKSWLDRLHYRLFWQGIRLPGFTRLTRQEFNHTQTLDGQGLVGLAYSQGFTPAAGDAWNALVTKILALYQEHQDNQGQVTLRYRTRLYLATLR
ncbi:MAG: class I SAM-dependent methyltransferase [Leptolyngbyaceae cyanobacterium SM2_5_2]|nr:class I SAM-dependent methyltransferase [Leptolyngbyaceae cyanobacterium SM2_5_2]